MAQGAWESLLQDYADHLALSRHLSGNTVRAYSSDLLQMAAALACPVGDVTLQRLRGWLAGLLEAGAASSTIQRKVAAARGFFAWAGEQQLIDEDPALRLRSPKRSRRQGGRWRRYRA